MGVVGRMAAAGLALRRLAPQFGATVVRAGGCAAVVPAALGLTRRSISTSAPLRKDDAQRTLTWTERLKRAESLVGPVQSLAGIGNLLGDELESYGVYVNRLLESGHPIVKKTRGLMVAESKVRGLMVLLVSQAIQSVDDSPLQDAPSAPIMANQRSIAEVTELIFSAAVLHDGVIELRGADHAPEELKGLNFGNKIAILGGDYLLASACTALSRLHHPKVVEMMSDAISAVVEGSSCRTVAALHRRTADDFIDVDDWLRVIELTAGVVMERSCRSAAMIGGYDEQTSDAAAEFGRQFGLAYQIKSEVDSYLTSFRSNDMLTNLQLAPVVWAADNAPVGAADFLREFVQNGAMTPRDELALLDFVDKYDGVEIALHECEGYCSGATQALQGYRGCQSGPGWDGVPESEAHNLLVELLVQFPARSVRA